jgi:hypothetical protein
MGVQIVAQLIFNFGNSFTRPFGLTLSPLYPLGKNFQCPLNRKRVGPRVQAGYFGEKSLALVGN